MSRKVDDKGDTALMIAAREGHAKASRRMRAGGEGIPLTRAVGFDPDVNVLVRLCARAAA